MVASKLLQPAVLSRPLRYVCWLMRARIHQLTRTLILQLCNICRKAHRGNRRLYPVPLPRLYYSVLEDARSQIHQSKIGLHQLGADQVHKMCCPAGMQIWVGIAQQLLESSRTVLTMFVSARRYRRLDHNDHTAARFGTFCLVIWLVQVQSEL